MSSNPVAGNQPVGNDDDDFEETLAQRLARIQSTTKPATSNPATSKPSSSKPGPSKAKKVTTVRRKTSKPKKARYESSSTEAEVLKQLYLFFH